MKKIYIWGAGKYLKVVYEAVNKNVCTVEGIVDKNKVRREEFAIEGIAVESPDILKTSEFDYILISAKNYQPILQNCKDMGINENKILTFWADKEELFPIIDKKVKKIIELEEQLQICKWKLDSLPYELEVEQGPIIKNAEELLDYIIQKNVSLCRFGDGEFEIMRGIERPWFQTVDEELSERLKEIIYSKNENIVLAIANNFGNLDCYTEKAANAIRQYLYGSTRREVMSFFEFNRFYFDAYVSRPYMMYKDKNHAKIIFDLFKQVWNGRELLIVEGKNSKMGIGNDLFANAKGIRRIICPERNVFTYYKILLDTIKKNVFNNELVLVSLGPTATVLAYDLGILGVQTLDIGQIDNEYEWFIRRAEERIEIPGKCVAELSWCHYPKEPVLDDNYERQIIERIGIE